MNENREQQDQQRQQSSFDTVNNIISRGQNLRNNYIKNKENVKRLASRGLTIVRGGGAAQGVAGTAGTGGTAVSSPAWGTAAIILLIIIFIIALFIVIFGGENKEGEAGNNLCTGTCQASACSDPAIQDTSAVCEISTDVCCTTQPPPGEVPICSDVDQLLLSKFGVKIKPAGELVSCEVRQKIYRIYSIPTRSPRYLELLKPSVPFTLEFRSGTYGKASGYTPTGYGIQLTGFAAFISNDAWFNLGSFLLIHETGHLIRHRNSWITSSYPNASLILSDPGCYSAGYLITYSRAGTNKLSENVAESSALYVYNSKRGIYGTISSFNTQCDATYSWMKHYIYGDIIISL